MRFRIPVLLAVGLILLFNAAGPVQGAPQPASDFGADFVSGELIVGFKQTNLLRSFALPNGVRAAANAPSLDALNAMLVDVPAGQEAAYRSQLLQSDSVLFVEPNYIVRPADTIPNDPLWQPSDSFPLGQWDMQRIGAPAAWDVTQGSYGVVLAVLDSGIDANHPEFAGRLLPGYDFVQHDATPQDQCGHGTHVAGTAAATGNNAEGLAGLDWNARILPVRVLGPDCSGDIAGVVEGLVWAVDAMGADVINMSFGTSSPSRLLEYGTYYAYERGAALIGAAGNTGGAIINPAKYPWVLAVGASDRSDTRASFSSRGSQLDLMAPGVSILSTTPYAGSFYYQRTENLKNRYGILSGTSMAAPHVAGAAALLAGQPGYSAPNQIYAALTSTAEDLGAPGFDSDTGNGLLRVDQALTFDPGSITPPEPPPAALEYDMLSSSRCANIAYDWQTIPHGLENYLPIFGLNDYTLVDLPFPFTFGGREFAQATVSANGYLSFDGNGAESDNFIIPTATGNSEYPHPDWFAAPFWDNLNPSALSEAAIYAYTLGASPNRRYVLEWYRVPVQASNASSELTFQMVLYEGSNRLAFSYQNLSGPGSDGASATVGLEYNDGYQGQQWSYNRKGALASQQTILFAPHPPGDSSGVPGCLENDVLDPGGGSLDFGPFCLDVPAGTFSTRTSIAFSVFNSFAPLPEGFQSLNHFADITPAPLPDPPLNPQPQVCYHYTAQDVLAAGGRPQNLLILVYDPHTRMWTRLPTVVDTAGQRILAPVPHFSTFGVFAAGRSSVPETPPVTGAPKSDTSRLALPAGLALLAGLLLAVRRRG